MAGLIQGSSLTKMLQWAKETVDDGGPSRGHRVNEGDKPPLELVQTQRTRQYSSLSLHGDIKILGLVLSFFSYPHVTFQCAMTDM